MTDHAGDLTPTANAEISTNFRAKVKPLATIAALVTTLLFALIGLAVLAITYVVPSSPRPETPGGLSFLVAGLILLVLVFFAVKGAVMVWMRPVWHLARDLSPLVGATDARVRGRLLPFRVAIELSTPRGIVSVEGLSGSFSALHVAVVHRTATHDVGRVRVLPRGEARRALAALRLKETA